MRRFVLSGQTSCIMKRRGINTQWAQTKQEKGKKNIPGLTEGRNRKEGERGKDEFEAVSVFLSAEPTVSAWRADFVVV